MISRAGRVLMVVGTLVALSACTAHAVPSRPPVQRTSPLRAGDWVLRSVAVNAREWLNTHELTTVNVCLDHSCRTLGGAHPYRVLATFRLAGGMPANGARLVTIWVTKHGEPEYRRAVRLPRRPIPPQSDCAKPYVYDELVWLTAFTRTRTDHLWSTCPLPH